MGARRTGRHDAVGKIVTRHRFTKARTLSCDSSPTKTNSTGPSVRKSIYGQTFRRMREDKPGDLSTIGACMAATAARRRSSRSKWKDSRASAEAATALALGVAQSMPSRCRRMRDFMVCGGREKSTLFLIHKVADQVPRRVAQRRGGTIHGHRLRRDPPIPLSDMHSLSRYASRCARSPRDVRSNRPSGLVVTFA